MEQIAEPRLVQNTPPGFKEAWEMVSGQLRMEMSRATYESWVHPLQPLGYKEGVYRVGAINSYGRDWVESRLRSRITRLLESVYNQPLTVNFTLCNGSTNGAANTAASPRAAHQTDAPTPQPQQAALPEARAEQTPAASQPALPSAAEQPQQAAQVELPGSIPVTMGAHAAPGTPAATAPNSPAITDLPKSGSTTSKTGRKKAEPPGPETADDNKAETGRSRKIQLQRAYGTERARVIQPERGMFLTMYFFNNWLPLLGHSAMTAIIAARSLCYWNPMTGELRNTVETEISELARRASVSVRTMKDVLNNELVRQYFLRYKVRRVMTPNGVRTAGILLQVRMDDPLTPEDQLSHNLPEEEHWYTLDFEDEEE